MSCRLIRSALITTLAAMACAATDLAISFEKSGRDLKILIDGKPFASYVFKDDTIPRPYFTHVRAPDGRQITRNHPPIEGVDATDHATYHPGIWMAFGDINGADFWRNRARVRQLNVLAAEGAHSGFGRFVVENEYLDEERRVCLETCRYTIVARDWRTFLIVDSTIKPIGQAVVFGDQEEMGFGIRVTTPMAVEKGGRIENSLGGVNEAEVWGKQADWCAYSMIDREASKWYSVLLVPHPENFRQSWFHARDYGLLVANPFGRNAFTGGEKSAVRIEPGETLRLRFGLVILVQDAGDTAPDFNILAREYVKLSKESTPGGE